ncbi:MAG: gamma-glutamyl-gamma-aminobutyrate hydrolase family protein [Acidobacteria bacterium]|nr:gamma-glutamyl-gamma-aminobutyrate hydrolase family protein [Acidobacteriota bacterium]
MMQMPEIMEQVPLDQPEPLPFPFSQRTFCPYERIEQRIETVRVLVVNTLLREESDLSDVARNEWGRRAAANLARERYISGLALGNIVNNVTRLVRVPATNKVHLSEVAEAAAQFQPQAIVLSGTLSDFDYYDPEMLRQFSDFIRTTRTPVLGICGGHQLVGICFGAQCLTLDHHEPSARRNDRLFEYQYRFVRITDTDDPVFRGIHDADSGLWQDYTTEARILRVWQNHGLQLDRVPEGFHLLATSISCRNQMMVRRAEGQLIYSVQFHLEKSFQDLSDNSKLRVNPSLTPKERKRLLREEASSRTRWAHQIESRDGRVLFENFLREALEHSESQG